MARYIKRYGRVGHSLGPSEERGFAMWVGYDIVGVDADLSHLGFTNVDGWTDEKLAPYDITAFTVVAPDDEELRRKLGVEGK